MLLFCLFVVIVVVVVFFGVGGGCIYKGIYNILQGYLGVDFTEQDIAKDRGDRNRLQEQTTKGQASSAEVNIQQGMSIL